MSVDEKRDLMFQSETDGNAGFLRAARDGNLQEVLEYLKGSTDINTSNPNGLNALHLASKEGHLNIVNELLKRGANVEAATKKGNTALHIASLAGHEHIVKVLVDNGAHVNLQAQAGFTPLYMAAQEGHSGVVGFLLSNGGNQSLATEDGFTPLAVALQQGHDRVVSVLLEHDTKGKVRLPALHIAAKKDDVKSAALLLQNEQNNVDNQTKSGGLVNDTTKSGFTPLHIASHYGNTNVSNLLIQRGADVNYKAKNNITPLHVASRWGKSNMVQLLLDNKAIIDEKTRDGLTPLHCAARSGHEGVVDLLLEREAPHSSKTKNGLTPLHMAAQGDHVDCARLLLYHKANVDEVTVDYLTPLHVAAHCGNVKTAKLLLDRKCEPNARALNGFTPLHIACKKNRIKVVELLLKYGASIEATTESGLTPLHVASFMGHMNIVIYLIQHNANPDTPTVRGETSLHLAARANQTDIIRILLRNGATVDAKAREQQTPLHIASRLGNVDNVVLLLQHGANADATTKDKYTPLHIAAKEGHDEVAQVLLENGASHDVTTKKGFTPLHIAAKYGNIKVARLLLQKDANPDVQGKNGLTPLHVATHYNHVNVAQLLLENKADPHATAKNGYTPLHIAAKKNQMDIATALLEYGAKPNAESKNGFTPLHLASQEGHTDVVSLLLEKDANVNARAHNGLTPMHLAAQEDKVPVAEILVKYNSEIDSHTKAGYTPLHTACHFGQNNMVRFLLDQEASVSATTKVGYTPLHQAAQQGHVQVVNQLLKNGASPNAVTNNGQTPLAIAQKLGYISVVETLKPITEVQGTMPASEDKYKVVSPETMQETFISDSEDEGGSFYVGSYRSDHMSLLTFGGGLQVDDFLPQSPLFGKPVSEQHVYLPYYEGQKMQMHGKSPSAVKPKDREDSISLERGGSASPLDTSFDKDVVYRYPATDQREATRRGREVSEIGAAMHYPSYLDSGPDYEAEMKYFQGDTLSPKAKDYMEAQQMSQSFTQSYSAAPPRFDGRAPASGDNQRFSSYSGSSFSTTFDPDNVPVDRSPVYSGKLKWKSFLISFMVDARGGAMRGCRHSGIRVVIPPKKCSMPTRVTCRLIKKEKLMKPPPTSEGEGLAARILEMGPVGTQFLGPIIMEIPHYASLRGKEREVVVMRSDNGESWYEHPLAATEEAVSEALGGSLEDLEPEETLHERRITRILTTDFPQYFALVTRVKQEAAVIGYEGGVLSSTVVPQVQAVLPEGTLTKPIKVGLQAQPVAPELVAKLLGNRVAVSPIVTVEPRRRKFHKPITLTIPVPKAAQKGMINQYGADRPTLRLIYSLAGNNYSSNRADPSPTNWEDLTDTKPITLVNDCVSFTTTVSARFWLIDCQNISEVTRMASALYHEAITVPYMAKFVVFGKRTSTEEGRLRMFCMTDDKVDKTLEKQEKFVEIARSRDIEVLEGRPQYVEMAGNLIPMTKSGDQLHINFKAFRENRLPSVVKVRDPDQDAAARVAFMKEPKLARGEAPQTPICNLNIRLPDTISSSSSDVSSDTAVEIQKRHSLLREQGIVVEDSVTRSSMNLSDVADNVQGDWVILAQQLGITMSEINRIKTDYSTLADQALAMLQLWVEKNRDKATGNALETALQKINREDVVKKCMYNTEVVNDEMEAAAARVAMDQSGFDTFKEEVGITKDSMKRGMSLDVQYDEQDMIKESESAEESSPGSERGSIDRGPAPQAIAEASISHPESLTEETLRSEVDQRRPVAVTPQESEEEAARKREAFISLAKEMDRIADLQEQELRRGESEERDSVQEEEIVRSAKEEEASAPTLPSEEYTTTTATTATAPDQEDGAVPDEEVIHTPPPSPTEKFSTAAAAVTAEEEEEEEEERVEEFTEIIETFQSSDDGGKTWKTYKKTIRITPQGTSENVEVIEDSPAPGSSFAAEAASRLSSAPDASTQVKAQPGSDVDGKVAPVSAGLVFSAPGQQPDESDTGLSPMSDGSYKEGPASVPEPSLPEDFLEEEEQYQQFELKADLGDEGFIDRREETVAVVPHRLSPDEVPEREEDFKTCLNDYTPPVVVAAAHSSKEASAADTDCTTTSTWPPVIVITEDRSTPPQEDADVLSYFGLSYEVPSSSEVEHEFPKEEEEEKDKQQVQETAAGMGTQPTSPQPTPPPTHSDHTVQQSQVSVSVLKVTHDSPVDQKVKPPDTEATTEEKPMESVTQTFKRSSFGDEYRRTEIEITEKETVITDRQVHTEECTVTGPFPIEDEVTAAAPASEEQQDVDMEHPDRGLFQPFDKHQEEATGTETEKQLVDFEQTALEWEEAEGEGTCQQNEDDFVEAQEELATEPDTQQAAGTVADTAAEKEEPLLKPSEGADQEVVTYETAPEDYDLEEEDQEAEFREAEDISPRKEEQDIAGEETTVQEEQPDEVESTHKPDEDILDFQADEKIEQEVDHIEQEVDHMETETEEETKKDTYSAELVTDTKQMEDQLGEMATAEERYETEEFMEASEEMPIEQPEQMLEAETQRDITDQHADILPDAAEETQQLPETEEKLEAGIPENVVTSLPEDSVCSAPEEKEPVETYTELQYEGEELESDQTESLQLDARAEPAVEAADEDDEEWEILDKTELTEEEQIAAMDETLMHLTAVRDEQQKAEGEEVDQVQETVEQDEHTEGEAEVSEETRPEAAEMHEQEPVEDLRQEEIAETVQHTDLLDEHAQEIQEEKRDSEDLLQGMSSTEATERECFQEDVSMESKERKDTEYVKETREEVLIDFSESRKDIVDDSSRETYQQELHTMSFESHVTREERTKPDVDDGTAMAETLDGSKDDLTPDGGVTKTEEREDQVPPTASVEEEEKQDTEESVHTEPTYFSEQHIKTFVSTEISQQTTTSSMTAYDDLLKPRAFDIEDFTQEMEDTKSPAMSLSTQSTEAGMISSEEGLFQQEQVVMAADIRTEAEQVQRPECSDLFEPHSEEVDLYEPFSDRSEEELKHLKTAVDSPTEEPTRDFIQELVDQPALETQESRPSPGKQVVRSPTEEQVEELQSHSPVQDVAEDVSAKSPLAEQQAEIFEEETEIEQVAVCGIMAEIQDMEQYAEQGESEEEPEDGLEQYEEETCEDQPEATEQVAEKFIDRTESFSLDERDLSVQHEDGKGKQKDSAKEEKSPDVYVDRVESFLEGAVKATDVIEEEKQQKDSADEKKSPDVYVDRVESFLEGTVKATDVIEEEKQQKDSADEEKSPDNYVDRVESFLEGTVKATDVIEEEKQQKDSADEEKSPDNYVDRVESFLEGTVKATDVIEEEKQQKDKADEEKSPDNYVDRVESFLEGAVKATDVIEEEKQQKDSTDEEKSPDNYVDRVESFLEGAVKATDVTEEEKQQREMSEDVHTERVESFQTETFQTTAIVEDEDLRGAEFSEDSYVDRKERFVEHPLETVAGSGEPGSHGSIPEVTGRHEAEDGSSDQVSGEQQSSVQRDTSGQDQSFGVQSDMKFEESAQSGTVSGGVTYTCTSHIISTTHGLLSEGTASQPQSDYTSRSETRTTSEYTVRGSQPDPKSTITVGVSETTIVEETAEGRHEEYGKTHYIAEDASDRPMSPSEYTLITTQGEDPATQTHDPRPEDILEEEEEGEDKRGSQSGEDEQGSERPPSPTEYTLVSSQEQDSLTEALGLQPPAKEVRCQEPGEEALIQFPDSADSTDPNISSDQYFQKESDTKDESASQIEPSCMPPSQKSEDLVRSSSYENLYQGLSVEAESPLEPVSVQDLDIGDRFDTRHTEPHLKSVGRTSSFEGLYDIGVTSHAFTQEGGEESGAGVPSEPSQLPGADDDRVSSASSDAARLEDVDGAGGREDRSIRTDEESGDDNYDVSAAGDDDESYTHRVVMRKEVHQKTTIRPDGQEETVIREDSQIHQDSEPPEDLRKSMEEIMQHFMQDSPRMPRLHGEPGEEDDDGTEV
ncbi:uncharacterized protein LOC143293050 isoform X37 [Babylonia areolata]|uniref:uncharacterized protein LOC143293050 isoform X37 n=1 Tax=Babylonia areolata TaxID=304850 RepID=UPI003FD4CDB4